VRHARDANELPEVASNELRAIVGDDSRLRFRPLLLGSLQNHFDVSFSQWDLRESNARGNDYVAAAAASKPVPLRDGLRFHQDKNPACFQDGPRRSATSRAPIHVMRRGAAGFSSSCNLAAVPSRGMEGVDS